MKPIQTIIVIMAIIIMLPLSLQAQKKEKDGKKLKEEKEWIIERGKKRLDNLIRYNEDGKKVEEIKYASFGQKERITYEYNTNGKVSKKVYYDERDKEEKTVVPEYDNEGVKIKETVYFPNGKVKSVKEFEYVY